MHRGAIELRLSTQRATWVATPCEPSEGKCKMLAGDENIVRFGDSCRSCSLMSRDVLASRSATQSCLRARAGSEGYGWTACGLRLAACVGCKHESA